MKVWTKTEKKSARIQITITYRSRNLKQESQKARIRPFDLDSKEYKQLLKLIEKYGY